MKNGHLEETLTDLGFSSLESKIYLALLAGGKMSAYQLAKSIEISRPSIYNALEHMLHKGIIESIPNPTALYIAVEPEILLEKLQKTYTNNIKTARSELQSFRTRIYDEQYANLHGAEVIIEKIRYLIQHTNRELYINTDMDLNIFKSDFETAVRHGVRVAVFSFYDFSPEVKDVEIYSHKRPIKENHAPTRFMMAVDEEQTLVVDIRDSKEDWKAVVTDNRLMVKIVSEHIHNDIYLLNIRNRYGREIYEDYLHIHTAFEDRERGMKS